MISWKNTECYIKLEYYNYSFVLSKQQRYDVIMSAKQLEEFIGVIETAERLASKENALDSKRRSSSSLWSYPTDIFTPRHHPRDAGSSRSPSISPMRVRRPLDKIPPPHGIAEHPQVTNVYLY